jgi:hypothetical protein
MRNVVRYLLQLLLAALIVPMANPGAVKSGSNTCPSSGNKAISSAQIKAAQVIVMAAAANTGKVYVGGSTVTSTEGVYLNAGDSVNFAPRGTTDAYDLSAIYFACAQSADTITYTYAQ